MNDDVTSATGTQHERMELDAADMGLWFYNHMKIEGITRA